MATEAVPRLTLYSREGCHLCSDMHAALRALRRTHAFDCEIVDVDASAELTQRYGDRVPVLACGAQELCHARLDAAAVTAFLQQFR
jgi:hypothetical protein